MATVLVLIAVIAFFNITSQYALDPKEMGTEFEGTAAIAQIKANAEALAGPITDEEATEALREFKEFVGPDGEVKDEYRMDRTPYGEKADEYWEFRAKNGALMALLTSPWMQGYQMPVSVAATIDTTGTVDLYGRVRSKIASELDANGAFSYNDDERAFWSEKAQGVRTPIEYGYAGGWEEFLDLAQFLIFAMLAVVITCASVFNGEYRAKNRRHPSVHQVRKIKARAREGGGLRDLCKRHILGLRTRLSGNTAHLLRSRWRRSTHPGLQHHMHLRHKPVSRRPHMLPRRVSRDPSPPWDSARAVSQNRQPHGNPRGRRCSHLDSGLRADDNEQYREPHHLPVPLQRAEPLQPLRHGFVCHRPCRGRAPVFLAAFYLLLFAASITLAIRTFKRHQVA